MFQCISGQTAWQNRGRFGWIHPKRCFYILQQQFQYLLPPCILHNWTA